MDLYDIQCFFGDIKDFFVDNYIRLFKMPNLKQLFAAIDNNNESVMQIALRYGSDFNKKNKDGITALVYALQQDSFSYAAEVIGLGRDGINTPGPDGTTPLMLSICSPNYLIPKKFMEKGADVNAKNSLGLTAMHYAAIAGNGMIIALLHKNGADINAADNDGYTPLDYTSNQEIRAALVQNGANGNVSIKDVQAAANSLTDAMFAQRFAETDPLLKAFKRANVKIN